MSDLADYLARFEETADVRPESVDDMLCLTAALRDIDALCAAWDTTPTPGHEGFYQDGVDDGRYQAAREIRRILDRITHLQEPP